MKTWLVLFFILTTFIVETWSKLNALDIRSEKIGGSRWSLCSEQNFPCSCSGTENGLSVETSPEPIKRLRQIYENCSIVVGNLEITGLKMEHLLEAGGSSPENALSFLENIEEVIGYVLLSNNEIPTLSLPNLRIIWGDHLFSPKMDESASEGPSRQFGLLLQSNQITTLDVRSLRAVHSGEVGMYFNPSLCHWRTLDFRQILGESFQNRLQIKGNFKNCLNDSTCAEDCQSCFGESSEQCQKIYRNNCAPQCSSGMCFNSSMPLNEFCCHPECTAGCWGPSSSQCYGCAKMKNDDTCVDKCPDPEIYIPQKTEYEKNPHGKYAYNRMCVKHCPNYTAIYRDGCVSRCPEGYSAVMTNGERHCVQCKGNCPKTCKITEPVSPNYIHLFENCTHVDGRIVINRATFEKGSDIIDNKPVHYKGLSVSDLELMSNVREVSDYVVIQSEDYLRNLNFLRNLQEIHGRKLFENKFSLHVIKNYNLKYFGTNKLKFISHGEVLIQTNHDLCYVDKIPWKYGFQAADATYADNRNFCDEEGSVCDVTCDQSKGCWGPGPLMCYDCQKWKLNNTCVENCDPEAALYEVSPKVCEFCHPECLRCNGSTSRNCTKCRHVSLNRECVDQCPSETHFHNQTSNVCEKCHDNCFSFGCSGPGNFVGPGGCNKCKYGFFNSTSQSLSPCLLEISSNDHCSNVDGFENYYWSAPASYRHLVESAVCLKCHDACKSCTSFGQHSVDQGCQCKTHRIYRSESIGSKSSVECGFACQENNYNTTIGNIVECRQCHSQCLGCFGPLATECYECKSFRSEDSSESVFNCTDVCPSDRPFYDANKLCTNIDVDKLASAERKKTNVYYGVAAATVFLLMIVVCVLAFVFRRRTMMLSKLTSPDEAFEMNVDAKPDLSRLRLIADMELKMGDILGYGAFGTVFKGVWTPQENNKKIPVAIKVLHESQNPVAQQEMLDEAGHMARVSHRHLVRLIGVCLGKQLMLVTPLMPLGNLLDYVQNNDGKIGSACLLRWCTQIAAGMAHLEECRLVHRDLAARNVLVQTPYHVRITDFGLAKMLDYGEEELCITEGKMPIKWLALECIQYRRYTHKSDVWAFGVTVWELLTFGEKPYKDVPLLQIPVLLDKGERLQQPQICTLDVYMILIKCWMVDADSRPSFVELKDTFAKMAKDPGRYLVVEGDKLLRLPSYSAKDQLEMMKEFVDDPDVDPVDYLPDLNESISPPMTPLKPLLEEEVQPRPRAGQRLQSTNSRRYASDPLNSKVVRNQLAMDVDNYLVPDSQAAAAADSGSDGSALFSVVTYTPVVTGSLTPEDDHTYYNDLAASSSGEVFFANSKENRDYLLPNSALNAKSSSTPLKKKPTTFDRHNFERVVQNETVV